MVLVRLAATNALINVDCTPDMRVVDLKKAIYESQSYPMKKQKLYVNGRSLKDKKKVADVVDASNDIVDVSINAKGGCCGFECDLCCCDFGCCI
jgi:hypothetical protein